MGKTVAPLLAGICWFLAVPASSSKAVAGNAGTRLSLTTDYLFARVDVAKTPCGGHWLRLHVALDEKGGGKGKLVIDPNSHGFNKFGDPTGATEIATFSVDITAEAVKLEDPAQKGRQLYEIKGKGLTGRLFLVVSPRGAGPSRLIVQGKGQTSVFPVKDAGQGQ